MKTFLLALLLALLLAGTAANGFAQSKECAELDRARRVARVAGESVGTHDLPLPCRPGDWERYWETEAAKAAAAKVRAAKIEAAKDAAARAKVAAAREARIASLDVTAEGKDRLRRHEIWLGATPEMARLAWGHPQSINRTITTGQVSEQWVYGLGTYLYFTNGKLTSIQQESGR